ncbi:enoyl-CoA hydratase/isomerase family protein [Nocardioides carbamazepini]|uniref:enoyl-CoA hydratase/isomerase family protein n=1 Tax=Nocardioides carbamazepini TaxID=2854259 RepID=UPI002149AE96|nr:enoyl-CoA hydratase-related protein [Nocardioides carbamazepini]MCR1786327.1 enoyl-CoA hydratase/isomerase family protein [Nocardioides carbamazepini]
MTTAMKGTELAPADDLIVERAAGIATITLNRPRRKNSVTSLGWADLRDAFRSIDPRMDRVVVLTGAGDTFCAGADLAGNDDSRSDLDNMRIVGEACLALHRVQVPTIAAVDGAAVGAGMNMALACDFVIATDRSRFSEIFVRRALSVDFGGSWLLPRLVGMAKAKELVLLGDFVSGPQMLELGLAHDVVGPEALEAAVAALAQRLLAGPQSAIMLSKALLNDSFEVTLERALDDEARAQALNLVSDDAREAAAAFLNKREPNFLSAARPHIENVEKRD